MNKSLSLYFAINFMQSYQLGTSSEDKNITDHIVILDEGHQTNTASQVITFWKDPHWNATYPLGSWKPTSFTEKF